MKNSDINTLSGIEFENLIYNLFTKLGFRVQLTKASGDGGIDLIAHYDGLVFKGKYLIQCKRWKGTVGEPELRDLYGTTVSENALKGILVTSSSFTKQAQEFSRGKNLELIDGSALSVLLESINESYDALLPLHTDSQIGFLNHTLFDKERYLLFDERIKLTPKGETPQSALIDYLMSSIIEIGAPSLKNGLISECNFRIHSYIELFGKGKSQNTKSVRNTMIYKQSLLKFISGKYGESIEMLSTVLTEPHIFHPFYETLKFALAAVLNSSDLMKISSDKIIRFMSVVDNPKYADIIFNYVEDRSLQNFHQLLVFWPSVQELNLEQYANKFNLDYTQNMSEHHRYLQSYGLI
ncbi:restriction endonuclease [Paenibacillus sp. 19GGS1-52]|uniref:restriction endonuclease n=1 Tax=Paenibacillus sp. 19GGS1-52 TaxID=2758563 RepID=UPI001EFA333D|nr:restriction endonuclease [Paenibacillus sp. 19GGS1-52]ULO04806.1 restriction endonuclease [Paenibacillus sp. 19GGS1-52]